MQPGTIARMMSVVLAIGVGALGLHAIQAERANARCDAARTDAESKLAICSKSHDDEKRAREASDKTATAAAADLNASRAELDELRHEKEETEKRLAVFKTMTEKFRKMIDSGKLQVTVRHGRMIVKLPAGVLFPSGSADLSKEGKDALTDVAHILKQFPDRRFEVAGHTDNVPIVPPSPFKNNLELSTGRALTVAQFLTSAGMNPARLSAAGYSEFQPAASNAKEAGRQENRRIEIVLQPNLSELPAIGLGGVVGAGVDAGAPPSGSAAPAKEGALAKDAGATTASK